MDTKAILKNSLNLLGRRGVKYLCIAIIAAMGIALVELCISFIIQLLLTSFGFFDNKFKFFGYELPKLSIYFVSSALVIVAIIRFSVQLTTTQTAAFLRDYVLLRLKKNSLYRILYEDDVHEKSSSNINFKLSEVFSKSSEFVLNFTHFIFMFVQSTFLFLMLFIIAWKEAIVATTGIAIIGLAIIYINKNVSRFAKQVPLQQKKLNEGIEKIARNYLFIKLMKKREDEFNSFCDSLKEYSSKSVSANFYSNLSAQTGPFLGIFLLVIIIIISNNIWHTSSVVLLSFIYLLARFVQGLSILTGYFGNSNIFFPQYKLSLESISNSDFKKINKESHLKITFFGPYKDPLDTNKEKKIDSVILSKIESPEIILQNVTFSYPKSTPLFKNINITINKGSQVGLIGSSGTGKSTILMLMTGILQPNSGKIQIDGVPAWEYISKKEARIGYVGPEPYLIKGDLKENLCYGLSRQVNEEEIMETLKLVSLQDFVLEKGLSYKIGENHTGLSAGQKQRVCLARAILNKPSLLILDEATANLDEKNESLIADALKNIKLSCTTIIVSHRYGILAFADEIIDMKNII
ncbi:ATP-binding cassette domain-containing protein [Silvanigrella sp.]|uniref:ATP-binding cassette domain-containing protein n=1 Tax=Silvanigrella sp. TaxID=2024976 RepID=UPI0037CBC49A|nr:ABC transporter ATP-binding protein/permease [Silvanigrellaceae bacterium]